jgi:hypothetical protein
MFKYFMFLYCYLSFLFRLIFPQYPVGLFSFFTVPFHCRLLKLSYIILFFVPLYSTLFFSVFYCFSYFCKDIFLNIYLKLFVFIFRFVFFFSFCHFFFLSFIPICTSIFVHIFLYTPSIICFASYCSHFYIDIFFKYLFRTRRFLYPFVFLIFFGVLFSLIFPSNLYIQDVPKMAY